jgi:hypothetical protein
MNTLKINGEIMRTAESIGELLDHINYMIEEGMIDIFNVTILIETG